MANKITTAGKFIPLLDEVYRTVSLTAKLDGPEELVRQGANANELIIPMIELQGLGDYDRNSGYVSGDVTLTNETVKCNFDRGRMFTVDNMDDADSAGIAFGRLAGEFIRTKVAPELDAFRFASYASKEGVTQKEETLSDGAAVLAALRVATNAMDEAEVPMEDRHLFITPTLDGMIADLDTTKSREILSRFASKTLVPQTRFYTAIDQKDGHTGGQEAGGYAKAEGGKELNFMVIHKPALIQFEKHVAPKIVTPDQNQEADAYKYGYRNVGVADVYKNKLAGVYASNKPA
ncbi:MULTISPECIES: hypothetical protein [Eubacteriales]|uniref:hypothetical protein n=1 Tax=Eubacteriales TaxID=186802 RepID=UPI000B382F86|nr:MULTISPECIES: hypothetical protein [Eubacteriales]MDY4166978.1 hypothetical protein [Fournierella sp.]OUP24000.1 hypothetical protein B5F28_09015 [Gemmiger sp. An194]